MLRVACSSLVATCHLHRQASAFAVTKRHRISLVAMANAAAPGTNDACDYAFGPYTIHASEVFATSDLSFAFVNLKPVVPGHVLISPKRVLRRFADLSPDEVADMWTLAQQVGSAVEGHYKAGSLTLAIQDGPLAGQTVPHVHIHVLPRKAGDFEKNDEVYDAIDEKEVALGEKLDLDKERTVRTPAEMAAEAAELRHLFGGPGKLN